MEQFKGLCREVGEWSSDGNTGRGAIIIGSAVLAAAWTGWRWLRGNRPAEQKTNVTVVASKGESVKVSINEREQSAS